MDKKQFEIVKKGYNPVDVDSYIVELQKKIKEYEEKEKAIHDAIIRSQMVANDIIEEAKNEVNKIKNQALQQVARVGESVVEIEQRVMEFQEEYAILIRKYIQDFVEEDISNTKTALDSIKSMVSEELVEKAFAIKADFQYRGTQAEKLKSKIEVQ